MLANRRVQNQSDEDFHILSEFLCSCDTCPSSEYLYCKFFHLIISNFYNRCYIYIKDLFLVVIVIIIILWREISTIIISVYTPFITIAIVAFKDFVY